ncbi:MAG: hypothetical protein FJ147_20775 [Deltaproteobacteria bacterium]|nr:hypothetical protein [Deltaproteobacteria bacterium]
MVGVPGTEERVALAEVEERLRRVRSRINWYGLQRNFYISGTIIALGVALLIVCAFSLPPLWFTVFSWPVLLALVFALLFFLRRTVSEWLDLNLAARHIDTKLALKERFSTLVAQLTSGVIGKPQPSQLWPHLLRENTTLLSHWTTKQVLPHRIPWHILPFFLASLIALFILAVPLMSSRSDASPFSLDNLQQVLGELPERATQAFERQMSLLPEPSDQWGKSSLYNQEQPPPGAMRLEEAPPGETRPQEARSLASLPEALQQKIRQALQGLPDKAPKPQEQKEGTPGKEDRRLALKPSDKTKTPDAVTEAKNLPPGTTEQQIQGNRRGQGNDKKGGNPTNIGSGTQTPAQGSGIQQLERAQLDRKPPKGAFQPSPDSPQMPSSGGEAGAGGPGAGSGTDPRLYGEQSILNDGSKSFQLALETTHEKTHKGEESETEDKDEGGIIEKSTGGLSQQQSLDDTIRKSRIPAEYEDIVKRVFTRGESR